MITVEEQEPVRFRNGWPCKQCGRLTEHKKVRDVQVCLVCGAPMREVPDVKAKQREYQRHFRSQKLEKKMGLRKKEASA